EPAFILVEDWRAKPSHKFLLSDAMPALVAGDEVYYVVTSTDIRDQPHWRRIFSNSSPLFHAFEIGATPPDSATVPQEVLINWVASVEKIVLGAYDGESYVIGMP